MAVTTVAKTIGTTGTFSTLQLWEDGAPANLTTSNNWTAGTFVGTFTQGEVVTGTGITGGKLLDTDGSTYITFGTTTTPAAGITITGSTSGATCVISGAANVGVIWQGQCQNQTFSGASLLLTFSGSTSSSTAYKHLTTVAGASFRDNANVQTNALHYNTANGVAITQSGINNETITTSEGAVRLSGLQIAATGTGGRAFTDTAGGVGTYDFNIFEGTYVGTSATLGVISTTNTKTVRNCLVIQRATAADHIVGTGTSSTAYTNCTFVAPDDLATAPTSIFLSGASGSVTAKNCSMFAGDSTKAIKAGSATFTFTTCYSDISGTTGVTQTTYGNEFQNVNDATRDFRLVTGAAGKDTGTTDSTNAANDIAGTARPSGSAYDVGCWEFVQAAGRTTKNTRSWPLGTEIGMGWRMNQ